MVRKKGRASVLHGTTAPPLAADDQPLQLMASFKSISSSRPLRKKKKNVLKPVLGREGCLASFKSCSVCADPNVIRHHRGKDVRVLLRNSFENSKTK